MNKTNVCVFVMYVTELSQTPLKHIRTANLISVQCLDCTLSNTINKLQSQSTILKYNHINGSAPIWHLNKILSVMLDVCVTRKIFCSTAFQRRHRTIMPYWWRKVISPIQNNFSCVTVWSVQTQLRLCLFVLFLVF